MRELNLIRVKLGDYNLSNSEYLFSCPFCYHHKKKLSINFEKNVYKCWVCLESGSINNLMWSLGYREFSKDSPATEKEQLLKDMVVNKFKKDIKINQPKRTIKLPKEYLNLIDDTSLNSAPARAYLRKKGVGVDDIIIWKIGYCEVGQYEGCIIIPSFDKNGEIDYYAIKSYANPRMQFNIPKEIVEKKDIVFNTLLVNWKRPVTIVEGIFDAVKTAPNSLPLIGKILYENSKTFQTIVSNNATVYVALDKDAKRQELESIILLKDYGIRTFKIKTNDIEDIGSVSKQEVEKRRKEALEITSIAKYKLTESR